MLDSHDDNTLSQPLSNAVEALCNVLYLIEQHIDDPDSLRTLLKLAETSMETIKRAASGISKQDVPKASTG